MSPLPVDNAAGLVDKVALNERFEAAGIPMPPSTTFTRLDDGLRGRERSREVVFDEFGVPLKTWTEDQYNVISCCCRLMAAGFGTSDVLKIVSGEKTIETAERELAEQAYHIALAGRALAQLAPRTHNPISP